MKAKVLFMAMCLLCSTGAKGQELGANYNENIGDPLNEVEILKKSKVTWVRGFINIPAFFLRSENGKITGVKEDVIKAYIPTLKYVQAKKALGNRVKFILSLKIPFRLYAGIVPKVGSEEIEYVFRAAELLLHTYNMGGNIDILVMGNEPEFENKSTATGDTDAEDYIAFLNEFANRLAAWKQTNGWTFDIFAGALNRVSEFLKSTTVPAVVSVINTNPNVAGLDLHIHAQYIQQAENDLKKIRNHYGVTKKLICTEFSMVRALNPNSEAALGSWGTNHGYPATMKLYEYLNAISDKAKAGAPVGADEFLSLFHSFAWYPKNWYTTFYNAFKTYDTYAITGRFSVVPGGVAYTATTEMWELGAIYSPRFLGVDKDGLYNPSPLIYPDFAAIRDGLPVSAFVEGQREVFIQWGDAVDQTGQLLMEDEGGHETVLPLSQDMNYTLIEHLLPGASYHVSLVQPGGGVVWERDIKTKPKPGDFPLLSCRQAGDYLLAQALNLPEDVVSYKIKVDGRETGKVNQALNGQILSAEITFADGSVETLSAAIAKD
jgi:hypothetical protein